MPDTLRLSKLLADQQGCSRREAENYIHGGWVSVDGQIIEEPGHRIAPGTTVTLDSRARPDDVPPVTLLLNKPAGFGASNESETAAALFVPENRFVPEHDRLRLLKKHLTGLMLATPLDTMASGLVVVTQDARLMRTLVDDTAKVEQEFVVDVTGQIIEDGLARLAQVRTWQGKALAPIKVSWQSEHRLRLAMKAPPLGIVAHLCNGVGLEVAALRRIRIGRLPMAQLPVGQWRFLQGFERF